MLRTNTVLSLNVKRNAAFILFVLFGAGLFAQEKTKSVHLVLKASPGLYWLSATSPGSGNGVKFGFGYGANVEIGLNETIFLVTGLEVTAAGANYKSNDTVPVLKLGKASGPYVSNVFTGNASIQYLQIPVFFKMKTKEIGMLKYFGQFGLGSGIAISNSTAWTNTTTSTLMTASGTDTKSGNLNLLRESLLIGAGVEYNISGSTSLIASLMYDNGFTAVLPGGGNAPSSASFNGTAINNPNPTIYSKGITLTIGVLF